MLRKPIPRAGFIAPCLPKKAPKTAVALRQPQCNVTDPTWIRTGSSRGVKDGNRNPATQAKRVLVVEDEPMIRILLEDMLGELGYTVAAEAARIEEALEATKNADFDVAILDANLKGEFASPVADALVARGTPFVFATGYGELPKPYRDRPTLRKPFQIDGLKGMLQSALHS
jgi:CheY-like chemotaxis protein